ncbi:hypothetical protein E1B28_012464 [Marasmius oreades]|uniref:N-acetyltransferase domain-containing protein n=1 Tax=Marasmius oreades TaxID=181124 RepID=A0A9P7UNZ8_9AGAR|nr:uncharacterized protein E1B28_012464 [Marasmius oreades]KAG7088475.1 hypothetical protein E1B28_012464 [Marasmius oreades]
MVTVHSSFFLYGTMFTTERLSLRAVRESDYDNLVRVWNTESVSRLAGANYYVVPHGPKLKQTLDDIVNKSTFFAIIETNDKGEVPAFVGIVRMDIACPKNRDAEYGISLMPEFWGRGYGKEVTRFMVNYAFDEMAAHRVSLWVFSHNTVALALYKKIGFIEEGRRRKSIWVGGKWEDFIMMGILEDEWKTLEN